MSYQVKYILIASTREDFEKGKVVYITVNG